MGDFVSVFLWATSTVLFLRTVQAGLTPHYDPDALSYCRYLPGDAEWPSSRDWASLNSTIEGRLIKTVPLGAPCHDPTFNEAVCSRYQASWTFPHVQFVTSSNSMYLSDTKSSEDDPTSVMIPLFANGSCDPYTLKSSPCLIGNYPDYSIKVSSWKDAAAGVKFANKKNIRLVIKNTGHE
jgi:hypothetical protein